jgi:hypothetical protein
VSKLEEIKEAYRCSDHPEIRWLIERVEKLEKFVEAIRYSHECVGHYQMAVEALKEVEE